MRIFVTAVLSVLLASGAAAQTGKTLYVESLGSWHVRCFETAANGPVACSLTLIYVPPNGPMLMFTVLRNSKGGRFLAASADSPGRSTGASVKLDGHPTAATKNCDAVTCIFDRPEGTQFLGWLKDARTLSVRYDRSTGRAMEIEQDLDGIAKVVAAWEDARRRFER